MFISEKVLNRFWIKVDKRTKEECWEWKACKDKAGYGKFSVGKKTWASHRFVMFLLKPQEDNTLIVLHRCDNPKCCNPNHLDWGTHKDNMVDMVNKKRFYAHGPKVRSLLGDDIRIAVKKLFLMGVSRRKIASAMNISTSTVCKIVKS